MSLGPSFPFLLRYAHYISPADYSSLKISFTLIFYFLKPLMLSTSMTYISNTLSGFQGPPMIWFHYFPYLCKMFICLLFHGNPFWIIIIIIILLIFILLIQRTPHFSEVLEYPSLIIYEINDTWAEMVNVNTRYSACHSI
jgi:hypothetical protein